MSWLGRATATFTHADPPLALPLKGGSGGSVALSQVCRDSTPPCQLNPLLFNGHLQTMWTAVASEAPEVHYRRRIFEAENADFAGTFAVDFAVPAFSAADASAAERPASAASQSPPAELPPRTAYYADTEFAALGSDDRRPMLLVLHGLSGGSHEVYLRHCIAPLLAQDGDTWAVAVVNARGCANSAITTGVLFNARATWDVRQVARWARATFPNRPLFGLGFSLGANILTNYVGEEGAACLLSAAVVVGNPFDLQVSNKALQRTFLGRTVYETVMGASMKKLIVHHKAMLTKDSSLDFDRIMRTRYLYEFDREVQCQAWGYPTEEAYYRDASSSDSLLNIRIPFLAVQAKDDPIAVEEAVPYGEFRRNPYTVLCMTSLGGHLSWFEPGGGRWHAKPVANFLHTMATEIDLAAIPRDQLDLNANQRPGFDFDPLRRKMQIRPMP